MSTPSAVSDVVALTEVCKFLASCLLLALESLPSPNAYRLSLETIPLLPSSFLGAVSRSTDPMEALKVLPPAALYLLQNNILFVALANLTAPVFQVRCVTLRSS